MSAIEATPAPRVRARAPGMPNGHTHTGIVNNTSLSDHASLRAYARNVFHEKMIAEWRERVFADGLEDPVKVAVNEAVKSFGSPHDFTIWAWYANRIGVNNFIELMFEQQAIMRTCSLRNPAAAFHMRLKRFHAVYAPKGGAR